MRRHSTNLAIAFGALAGTALLALALLRGEPDVASDNAQSVGARAGVPQESAVDRLRAEANEASISARADREAIARSPLQIAVVTGSESRFPYISNAPSQSGAGLRFQLFYSGEDHKPLHEGVLDAEGKALVDLDVDRFEMTEFGRGNIVGRIVEPGYIQRPGRAFRKPGATGPFRLRLSPARGFERTVIVPGWKPLTSYRTHVTFHSKAIRSPSGEWVDGFGACFDDRVRVGTGGEVTIEFIEHDKAELLFFDGGDQGTASVHLPNGGRELPTDAQLELELRGEGRIWGTVTDADGRPAVGLALEVLWYGDRSAGEFDGNDEPLRSQLMARGEGRWRAKTVTDEQGAFEFIGLIPEDFRILATTAERNSFGGFASRELVTTRAAANAEPLRLAFTRPVIHVTIAPSGCDAITAEPADKSGTRGRVELHDAGPIGTVPWARRIDGVRHLSDSGIAAVAKIDGDPETWAATLDVCVGRQYFVKAIGRTFDSRPVLVQVTNASTRALVTLEPMAITRTGRLRPLVTSCGEPAHVGMYQVLIENVETGIRCERHGRRFEFVPGRYRVAALGHPSLDDHHGSVIRRRMYGRVSKIVDVVEGKTACVELDFDAGGKLEITVLGGLFPDDIEDQLRVAREFARRRHRKRPETTEDARRVLEGHSGNDFGRAEIWLVSETDQFIEPLSYGVVAYAQEEEEIIEDEDELATGSIAPQSPQPKKSPPISYVSHVRNSWPLGETHISEVLPTGEFTLRATFLDRREITRRVTIRPGETNQLTIDFGGPK